MPDSIFMWMPVVPENGLFAQRAVFTSLQGPNVAIGATGKPVDDMYFRFKKGKNGKRTQYNKLAVCYAVECR